MVNKRIIRWNNNIQQKTEIIDKNKIFQHYLLSSVENITLDNI